MATMNRRKFLGVAGVGAVAVATGAAGVVAGTGALKGAGNQATLSFRAVAGLPAEPLPNYCSYVIEGHIDLANKSGTVTETMYAGAPEAISQQIWSGFTRMVHVTGVRQAGSVLTISGAVADRSHLRRGESGDFQITVDRTARTAQGTFMGKAIALTLS
ncbi:MAG TPA: hypothetical protein VGR57_12000 [Ktedonobacterales bacterium]|nr:hypothetical protein [Ktedonobacterales bacterium]